MHPEVDTDGEASCWPADINFDLDLLSAIPARKVAFFLLFARGGEQPEAARFNLTLSPHLRGAGYVNWMRLKEIHPERAAGGRVGSGGAGRMGSESVASLGVLPASWLASRNY